MTKLTVAAKINFRANQRQKSAPRARVLAARLEAVMQGPWPVQLPTRLAQDILDYLKGAADAK